MIILLREIKYLVKIKYVDFDGSYHTKEYSIYADSKDKARELAEELFRIRVGYFEDVYSIAEIRHPGVV